MPISVYPRLRPILGERGLSVAELEQRIKRQFGQKIDRRALIRLTDSDRPLRRADLVIVGAVAAALDVSLGDLFSVSAGPSLALTESTAGFDPAQRQRLQTLLWRQEERELTPAEIEDLAELLGREAEQQYLVEAKRLAEQRGVSLDVINDETTQAVAAAREWFQAFQQHRSSGSNSTENSTNCQREAISG